MKRVIMIVAALVVAGSLFGSLGFSSETVKGAKEDVKKIKTELNTKLNEADKEIAELTRQARIKGETAKNQTLDELKATRKKIASEIEGLKDDGKANWKELKSKLADSIEALSKKAQSALKE